MYAICYIGVNDVEIDMDKQKVTVSGYIEHKEVLKAVRRTGRKAEYWPSPYDAEFYPFAVQYLEDNMHTSTYNYYQHGYNPTMHGYYPDPAYSVVVDDEAAWMFNEDNVNACAIM
jgi:Heavy-metal-associated domain